MTNNQNSSDDSGAGCCLGIVATPIALFYFGFKFHFLWWILGAIIFLVLSGITALVSSSDTQTSTPSEDLSNLSEEVVNVLTNLSNGEIRDPVSQETFQPGDKVYLCHVHYLPYHEDSYQDIGRKCMECGNNTHIKEHTVPQPIASTNGGSDSSLKIEFKDIK
jgi:hypothetical protein